MSKTEKTSELSQVLIDNAGIIHKLCFMYTNSEDEVQDLKQEISYQIVKSYNRFKGDSKVSTWVYKVALFTALSHLKTKRKNTLVEYDLPEVADDSVESDRWTEVYAEIKSLPPVDKSLVFLYLENKSYTEMADIMGLTESNIGVKLNRIKKKLKEKFN